MSCRAQRDLFDAFVSFFPDSLICFFSLFLYTSSSKDTWEVRPLAIEGRAPRPHSRGSYIKASGSLRERENKGKASQLRERLGIYNAFIRRALGRYKGRPCAFTSGLKTLKFTMLFFLKRRRTEFHSRLDIEKRLALYYTTPNKERALSLISFSG